MRNIPIPQQIYRHFKGNLYQIVTLAEHSESGEMLVVYQAMYGEFKVYARPLSMFLEKVDKEKYPDVTQEYRFEQMMISNAYSASRAVIEADGQSVLQERADAPVQVVQESVLQIIPDADKTEDEIVLDPLVIEFLDADTYEQRLNILAALHHRITDDMINTMAIAIDVEVEPGDIEQRYEDLKNCLLLYDKFECNRMR